MAPFMKNSSDTVIQDIILIEEGNFVRDIEKVCDIFNQYFINIGISIKIIMTTQHVSLVSETIVIHIILHLSSQMVIPTL